MEMFRVKKMIKGRRMKRVKEITDTELKILKNKNELPQGFGGRFQFPIPLLIVFQDNQYAHEEPEIRKK